MGTLRIAVTGGIACGKSTVARMLERCGGEVLDTDGEYGENTAYAVENLQRKAGMEGIWFGTVSSKTWELLLN